MADNRESEFNPYAAPASVGQAKPFDIESNAVAVRHAHLGHEASVRSFGLLYLLGGSISVIVALGLVISFLAGGLPDNGAVWLDTVALAVVGLSGCLQIWVGRGLRRLNKVGRIGGTIFGAIGLLGIPLGTLLSAYLLYLLWSEKGNMVFSPEYQEIMAATPNMKYKTSIVVWIILAIIVLLVFFGMAAIFAGA